MWVTTERVGYWREYFLGKLKIYSGELLKGKIMANYNVYFSPTGTTERVVKHMGESFGSMENIDLSRRDMKNHEMKQGDFCIVGVPSFGGRVPGIATERLRKMKGDRTPAFLLVTYGGRAYEDTLVELKDVLEAQGFVCIGAAAIVAEHSIAHQIEAGRPSAQDYDELDTFAAEVKERLKGNVCQVEVPGNRPYKEYKVLPMDIQVSDECMGCGNCAESCPVGAISFEDPKMTNGEACISCMRCVEICPQSARSGNLEKVQMISEKLKMICQPDKANEFF